MIDSTYFSDLSWSTHLHLIRWTSCRFEMVKNRETTVTDEMHEIGLGLGDISLYRSSSWGGKQHFIGGLDSYLHENTASHHGD